MSETKISNRPPISISFSWKSVWLLQIFICCFSMAMAQENKPAVIINKMNDDKEKIANKVFRYKEYTSGKVVFKDNTSTEVKMNHNQLSDKVLFISPEGDTLEFGHPETFRMIIIGMDSFYFFKGNYLQKISHYAGNNLAVSQTLKLIGKEKKGAYGMYSAASAINTNNTFTNNQVTSYLTADENAVFRINNTYFISDRFNNFFPANKKNFYKVFFVHEKGIKNFIDLHHTNFYKKEDLEQLLQYAQSLN